MFNRLIAFSWYGSKFETDFEVPQVMYANERDIKYALASHPIVQSVTNSTKNVHKIIIAEGTCTSYIQASQWNSGIAH